MQNLVGTNYKNFSIYVFFFRHFAKDGAGVIDRSKAGRIAELCANKASIVYFSQLANNTM